MFPRPIRFELVKPGTNWGVRDPKGEAPFRYVMLRDWAKKEACKTIGN